MNSLPGHRGSAVGSLHRFTAFSLMELMVATAILGIILALIFGITQQAGDAWKNSAAKIELFQSARAAFEAMNRKISQATLNTSYDYFDSLGNPRTQSNASSFTPARYGRYSDLHFISGHDLLDGDGMPRQVTHSIFFQSPSGYSDEAAYRPLDSTLNACGFYVEYNQDSTRPAFLDSLTPSPENRFRYRLMQFLQPAQDLEVYKYDPQLSTSDPRAWFTGPLGAQSSAAPVRPMAENIVALIILPKRSELDEETGSQAGQQPLAPQYDYDSRPARPPIVPQPPAENQLPPLVHIAMVAVDEPSFIKFGNDSAAPSLGQQQLFINAADLDSDLDRLSDILAARPSNIAGNKIKLRYQIFRSDVPIRAAKWSD